jgi:hypothetical protein
LGVEPPAVEPPAVGPPGVDPLGVDPLGVDPPGVEPAVDPLGVGSPRSFPESRDGMARCVSPSSPRVTSTMPSVVAAAITTLPTIANRRPDRAGPSTVVAGSTTGPFATGVLPTAGTAGPAPTAPAPAGSVPIASAAPGAAASTAALRSTIVWIRWITFFAMQRATSSSSAGARPGTIELGVGGVCVRCAAMRSPGVGATNGGRPVSAKNSTQPSA